MRLQAIWKISSLSVSVMVLRPVVATTGPASIAVVATTFEGIEQAKSYL